MIQPGLIDSVAGGRRPDIKFNATGFLDNVSGNANTLNRALPLVLAGAGSSWTSDTIFVAGFRSFMVGLQVSAGSVKFMINLMHPLTPTVQVEQSTFGTYAVADGHLCASWAALANNGGGGGGPLNTGGLDGRIYTHMQLRFEAVGGAATLSKLDGLWCAST